MPWTSTGFISKLVSLFGEGTLEFVLRGCLIWEGLWSGLLLAVGDSVLAWGLLTGFKLEGGLAEGWLF